MYLLKTVAFAYTSSHDLSSQATCRKSTCRTSMDSFRKMGCPRCEMLYHSHELELNALAFCDGSCYRDASLSLKAAFAQLMDTSRFSEVLSATYC